MNWLDKLEPIARNKDRRSPLYVRFTESIRESIHTGQLAENEKLPPDRELAKLLQVDRSTIARTYDQLESEGLVYSHVGRGTFVRSLSERMAATPTNFVNPTSSPRSDSAAVVWADKFSRASQNISSIVNRQVQSTGQPAATISFAAGTPTAEFFPQREFQDIVSKLMSTPSRAADMFGYSQPEGHPELREQVLRYLNEQSIHATDDQLLILSGSQQGIDLVTRTLVNTDDTVLMEDPTYFWAICNFHSAGAKCVPIAMDDEGVRLDIFEGVSSRVDAKLLYTMPSFQNPTGRTMSLARRKRLLQLAKQHQVPILEDNFVGDLFYDSQPLPSLRSLDVDSTTVIHQGTFSKALCPGLRLGWLVAPEPVMNRLRMIKRTSDLSTNSMGQLILAEYLRQGFYHSHVELVKTEYRRRLDTMCEALTKYTGDSLTWLRPSGGMFIWAKLPPGYSSRELLSFAEREGVSFSSGEVFQVSGGKSEYMRLTFIQQPPELIEKGVQRLARAIDEYAKSRRGYTSSSDASRVAETTFI